MNNDHQQQFQQNMQTGSGLTRYRSAPSSYFASLLNTPAGEGGGFGADDFEQLFNPRASSPETQRIFSRFMNSASDSIQENCSTSTNLSSQPQLNSQFPPPRKAAEPEVQRQQSNDYSSASQEIYQSHNSEPANSMESSRNNTLVGPFNSNRVAHMKIEPGGGNSGGLIRHSSSPAGLFANINIENGNFFFLTN